MELQILLKLLENKPLFYAIILLNNLPNGLYQDTFLHLLKITENEYNDILEEMHSLNIIEIDKYKNIACSKKIFQDAFYSTIINKYKNKKKPEIISIILDCYSHEFDLFCKNSKLLLEKLLEKNMLGDAKNVFEIIINLLLKIKLSIKNIQESKFYCNFGMYLIDIMTDNPWNINKILVFYYKMRGVAFAMGDQRTISRIDVAIGSLNINNIITKRSHYLHSIMRRGVNNILSFGDMDITLQVMPEICRYYYLEGNFSKATNLVYFYLSIQDKDFLIPYSSRIYIYSALSAVFLGKFDLALNILKLSLHIAQRKKFEDDIYRCKSTIAYIYILQKKHSIAEEILDSILYNKQTAITYGLISAARTKAYLLYLNGDIKNSYAVFTKWIHIPFCRSLIHSGYLATPFVFELLTAYDEAGFSSPYNRSFDDEIEVALSAPSAIIRGMSLRYAGEKIAKEHGWNNQKVHSYLQESLEIFKKISAPIETAKTLLLQCKYYLTTDNVSAASLCAAEASKISIEFGQPAWDHKFDNLIKKNDDIPLKAQASDHFLKSLFEAMNQQFVWSKSDRFFSNFLAAIMASLGAFRGGIFKVEELAANLLIEINLHERLSSKNLKDLPINLIKKSIHQRSSCSTSFSISSVLPKDTGELMAFSLFINVDTKGTYIFYFEGYSSEIFNVLNMKPIQQLIEKYIISEIRIHFWRTFYWENKLQDSANFSESTSVGKELLFKSEAMQLLVDKVDMVAKSDAPILILGESGVGKELIALQIHEKSGRKGRFIPVNIASTPESLFESEFYGHEKGSFTDAIQRKIGLFELADNGTLFIDEVGDIPLPLQIKLLRVLQEKQFMRVGGVQLLNSNFRLITATNVNLDQAVEKNNFRRDLFYRISVVPLTIPPLRDRPEDILYLAEYFARYFSIRHKRSKRVFSKKEKASLLNYMWPGNIRELENYIESLILLSENNLSIPLIEALCTNQPQRTVEKNTHIALPKKEQIEQLVTQLGAQENEAAIFNAIVPLKTLENAYFEYVYIQKNGVVGGENGIAKALQICEHTAFTLVRKLGLRQKYALSLYQNK